jgi:hypothetical protein
MDACAVLQGNEGPSIAPAASLNRALYAFHHRPLRPRLRVGNRRLGQLIAHSKRRIAARASRPDAAGLRAARFFMDACAVSQGLSFIGGGP